MFDELDSQPDDVRETALFSAFAERLRHCVDNCKGLERHLEGTPVDVVNDRTALVQLPILRKSDLMAAQQANPPFGDFVRESALLGSRLFMSPGPVWEPQVGGTDPWQAARALHAAGLRADDRVHNAFSYHMTPGGFILDEGARALGCIVFPAGVGNTETQVLAIRQLQPTAFVGTPDYLQVLLDHANAEGPPLSSIRRALVSGGALFPTMRKRYNEQGIHVQQCYATADLGVIAYESQTDGVVHPGMLINEGLIVEIVVPGTGMPVKPGDVGELVVTRLHPDYPLLRFATGDLSAEIVEPSPCGRTQRRLRGWMGRADQRAKVRGMFVDPMQLHVLPTAHPEIDRWRVVISRQDDRDVMHLSVTLKQESAGMQASTQTKTDWLAEITQTLKQATHLSGTVMVVSELPNDGIVIEDKRDYEQG